jgi:DNA-binding transcriptional MocR family regulator
MKLYEKLADDIAQSIDDGVLKKGEKIPSVRTTSRDRSVSASTVFQAYYLLEARGLIRARERSGYYVTDKINSLPQLPSPKEQDSIEVMEVEVSELIFDILESVKSRDVIPLGSAFPSPLLFPLHKLANAIAYSTKKMDPWLSVDTLSLGLERLRRQISLRYMVDGTHITPSEIVATNGALEGLNLCLMAVTKPGDTVLIESPSFYAALQSIERLGLKAVEVSSHPKFGIDLIAMEKAIKQHRPSACWIMTNFQNPLGSLLSDNKKKDLVSIITKHQIPLIEDDVYGELYFGKKRPLSAKYFDKEGYVMHCSSFSKCLAPGYRIGWVAPGRYKKEVARIKLTTSISASVPAQLALATYLEGGGYDKHLRNIRHSLLINQIKFIEAIEKYFPRGTRLTAPEGGYFLWIKLPDGTDALHIQREALLEGISIAPGPIFSAQRKFSEYIRLNYGHTWCSNIDSALCMLGTIIKKSQN